MDLLELCVRESMHIGGDLSSTDLMTVLWQYKMKYNPADPEDEDRDRFILSKSHASAVLCFEQAAIGCFSKEEVINGYAGDEGRFSMHSCKLKNPYVEVSTGSLGHGFPVACGIAAGLRLKGNKKNRVFCLMGDGEQSEGSIWEAAMNAVHYGLGNMVALIDHNGLEADGRVDLLTGLLDIGEKYRSFGWRVMEVDGNDMEQLVNAVDSLPEPGDQTPTLILCHTVKGKGVPFMENRERWHAGRLTEEEYKEALAAL